MSERLVNDYILPNMPTRVEQFISVELLPGIYPSGSCDALHSNDCIVDYKTYNSSTEPKTISQAYKYQLLIYAYIYRKMGLPIDRIRLVYVNRSIDTRRISEKTGKEIGKIQLPRVTVLTESITDEDIEFIESVLLLCAETYMKYKESPDLAYLLFRDYRLKGK